MAYYRNTKGNYVSDSGYKKYYFDNDANITNIVYRNDKKATNYKFWGMLPENTQIALYYYEKNNGEFEVYNSLMYENGLIKDKVLIWNGIGGSSINEGLRTKSRDAVLKSTGTYSSYDNTKIKSPQTDTEDSNKWKEQMTNKVFNGKILFYTATFNFDSIGNLTIEYKKNGIEMKDIYTFWGATNYNGSLYGLYYIYNNLSMKYDSKAVSTNIETGYPWIESLIFPEVTGYNYDYKSTNTSMTTTENDAWKSKVANKIIEEKEVENTYTFLNNGDIEVKTKNNKYYTLHFWGATNYYNNLCGIYYVKINLRDIFGNIAPNESTYFYYGYIFDEYEGYNSHLPELKESWQDSYYCREFTNWYEKYFDKNGNPKDAIDWTTMPIQESQYISFGNTQENIILMEK